MRNHRLGVLILSTCSVLCFEVGASGQTIQLPSFSRFTYSGSVLVPTGGSTSLGGVSRSATGRTTRGRQGRAFGAAHAHAGAAAQVTIIDNDAIDRRIRGVPAEAGRSGQGSGQGRSSVHVSGSGGAKAVANARKRAAVYDPDSEGKALVRFARKQFLAGQRTSAFDAYRLAIETLSPQLSELAKAECARVFPSTQRPVSTSPNRYASGRPAAPKR